MEKSFIFVTMILIFNHLCWTGGSVDAYVPKNLDNLIKKLENIKKELQLRIQKSYPEIKDFYAFSDENENMTCVEDIEEYVKETAKMIEQLNLNPTSHSSESVKVIFYCIPIAMILIFLCFMCCYAKALFASQKTEQEFKDSVQNILCEQTRSINDVNKIIEKMISKYISDESKIGNQVNSMKNMIKIDEMIYDLETAASMLKYKIALCFEDIAESQRARTFKKEREKQEVRQKLKAVKELREEITESLNQLSQLTDELFSEVNSLKEEIKLVINEESENLTSCDSALEDFTARICNIEMKIAKS